MRNEKACVCDPNKFVSCPGSDTKTVYTTKVQDDGTILLIPSGKENIKEKINSYVDQTDIAYIIRQLQLGDTSVINPSKAMYGDFTETPTDLRHAMQIMIDGEKAFYDLPLDTRQKFDNDFRKWLVSAGSPDWLTKMGQPITEPDVIEKEVNKEDDEKH